MKRYFHPVLFLITGIILSSCAGQKAAFTVSTFDEVEQISTDRPGRLDPVLVRFIAPIGKPDALAKAAQFSPGVKGSWKLLDDRTIEFTPERPYRSGKTYTLSVDSGLLRGKDAGLEGFTADFTIRRAEYEIIPDGLYTKDAKDGEFSFSGILATDVPVSAETAARMVSVKIGPKNAPKSIDLTWDTEENSKSHRFTVKKISRSATEQYLTIEGNGSPLDSKTVWSKSWLVPPEQDFRVLEIAENDPSCIQVRFSDPVDSSQDLRGLVFAGTNSGAVAVRYNLDGNVLKLYSTDGWKADTNITVLEGIRSANGKVLKEQAVSNTQAVWDLPEVRFANDGVILPTTNGVTVAVETRNLRGLIVEAYMIYGDNILQFLQENELDESYELYRVGEPVWSDAFDFNWDDRMKNRWVPRGLDLTELIKKNPGGMFQLRVTFRKRHVMYECAADHMDFSSLPMPSDEITADKRNAYSYWDNYDPEYKIQQTYWHYEKDPCHPAYYLSNYNEACLARKNILVSNLGIMGKLDADGTYRVTVADIGTTEPVAGAAVTMYSFAQKEIMSGVTDNQGSIGMKPGREPYFIVASKGAQTSYLRIDEGTSLSVSHFAVDGERPEKGVKGFIYGERGVWRPGDDIHLVFVLQDLKKQLPAKFPVTFELEDPQGRVTKSEVYSNSVGGFYRIDTATLPGDPTGPWIARVKAGGQTWTRKLRIEAVVPNRLAINLKTDKKWLTAHDNNFTLTGAWLHGAKAPGLKADVSVIFYPGSTAFDGYSEYSFTNPERSVESNQTTVWQGNLDANSFAAFNLDLNAGPSLPGKLKAQLSTRIFEPSGMFSVEQVQYNYSPYERYVGIRLPKGDAARGMLQTDKKHRVEIAVLDAEGKPVRDSVAVSLSMYKLQWRWWWEKDALTDATYVEGRSTTLIASGQTTVKNGKGSWDLEVRYPEWGRYLVVAQDVSGGHSSAKIVYIDWPGWAGRGQEAGTGSAAMLTLTQDKGAYKTGETALVSFSSSTGGRALVTVEKDGLILRQDWMETAQGTSVYKLPLTEDMAPNVYVHITLLQKHLQTANSLPIRLYGIIPLMVENPATRLSPVISAPDQFSPRKQATLTVSEKSGRPMTYTVAVVDEGLLGLTRFTVSNPWNEFYKKEASRLASWDIYRYVLSAFGGKLETLLSIGGSEDLLNNNNKKTERFKPVVLFFGPYELAANETATINFEMPQYVGAVRAMVVAGKNGAYGTAEQSVPVKGDLMILPTLPRTLGVNETIEVPVTVFNGKETARSFNVALTFEGALLASSTQKVDVSALGEKTINFRVTTDRAGKASVRTVATATDGSEPVEYSTEIDILSRGSPLATTTKFTVKPGSTFKDLIESPGEKGTKSLAVELSTLPVLDFAMRVQYLVQYPHGCVEQITSGGFPQLYLADMVDTTPEKTEEIKKNVISVIDRYAGYQTATGGFAYWPGSKHENFWGTCYAGHFMIEARKAGYDVPDTVFKPWLSFQQEAARVWLKTGDNDETVQAYRLYTLALAGYPDLGGMNRLSIEPSLPATGRWLLAGAYALSGHRSTAEDLTRGLTLSPPVYRETGNTWGSNYRDAAVILQILNDMKDTTRSGTLVPIVAANFDSDGWYSTQETAWMILALAPHYSKYRQTPATWSLEWDKGKETGEITRTAVIKNLEPEEAARQSITVTNTGTLDIFGRITTRGIIPAGQETKIEKGLSLDVQYLDAQNQPVAPSRLALGDSFTIRVTIWNLSGDRIENIALSLPIPTCWEFGNARVGSDETAKATFDFDYQDIKDTNICTYFALDERASKTFTFNATVAYNGNYYIPAIRAEAMYNADLQAVLPGQSIARIVEQTTPSTRNIPK